MFIWNNDYSEFHVRNFKRSKNSSAYRYGFSVGNLSGHFGPFALVHGFKWSFAQVHRIKIQNEVLSVSKCQ